MRFLNTVLFGCRMHEYVVGFLTHCDIKCWFKHIVAVKSKPCKSTFGQYELYVQDQPPRPITQCDKQP
jgi:hypothetical protein